MADERGLEGLHFADVVSVTAGAGRELTNRRMVSENRNGEEAHKNGGP